MKEVFAQRGTEVAFEDMKQGGTYLLDQTNKHPWNWLVEFDAIRFEAFHHKFSLASNGLTHESGFIRKQAVTAVFEATPDQKHLLMQTKTARVSDQRGGKVETPQTDTI